MRSKSKRYYDISIATYVLALLPFFVYFAIYGSLGLYPNYNVSSIDLKPLHDFELQLFGIMDGATKVIPGAYFQHHHHALLDLIAGFSYLCWLPVPMGYALWLTREGRIDRALRMGWGFLMVNLVGFVIYYVHPAAPPWYVINHGFEADFTTPGSCAGLARFDALTHVPFYHAFYDKNANVFAAMPSLHAAYMFIATLYAMRYRANRWVLLIFWLITLGTRFAAVYSAHHYIVDVIAGIIVSLVGIALFEWLNRRYKLYVSP